MIEPIYIQAAFIGYLTFSIPFLWNAYQEILAKKKHITGQKIENILTKQFYLKSVRNFERFLQYPVGILVFIGLFVPFAYPRVGLIVACLSFPYFLFLPQIFQKIEEKSSTSLNQFLSSEDAESSDLQKVFSELWQNNDDFIEKEFPVTPRQVYENFSLKIDNLLDNNKPEIALGYFNNFLQFIDKREIFWLIATENFFSKILVWHFFLWKKVRYYLNNIEKKEELNAWSFYEANLRALDNILQNIEERILIEKGVTPYSFFDGFKKHVLNYQEENDYLLYLLRVFYKVFFEKITSSPNNYEIWEYYFPKEWKINLENKEKITAEISFKIFHRWAERRIRNRQESDEELDEVTMHLFPEVDHRMWSRILIFIFCYNPHYGIKSVIEQPWAFGDGGRGMSFTGSKEDFAKMRSDQETKEKNNTFALANNLFEDGLSIDNLSKYIEELKFLENKKDSPNEWKRMKLLEIFTEMLEYFNQQESEQPIGLE